MRQRIVNRHPHLHNSSHVGTRYHIWHISSVEEYSSGDEREDCKFAKSVNLLEFVKMEKALWLTAVDFS